ncbi:MAG: response regulator, partial [Porphyromonas sp.]|nr:response regulator [Porphyromonas sp.]
MPTVLIIDDDSSIRASLTLLLKRAGYEVLKAEGPDQALAILRQSKPDVILMDMNFSLSTKGEEGLELLQRTKIFAPDTPVILLTAWGSIELAVRGMKAGAFDFISKPWDNRQLLMTIENAISITAESTAEVNPDFPNIIGQSTAMQELLQTVAR